MDIKYTKIKCVNKHILREKPVNWIGYVIIMVTSHNIKSIKFLLRIHIRSINVDFTLEPKRKKKQNKKEFIYLLNDYSLALIIHTLPISFPLSFIVSFSLFQPKINENIRIRVTVFFSFSYLFSNILPGDSSIDN